MVRGDRGLDDKFEHWHLLYRRLDSEDVADGHLILARIPSQDLSVNWSKYSKPWDVIFDHPHNGIAAISVCEIKKKLPTEPSLGAKIHLFKPIHDPLDNCYSHSEIAVFKEGSRLKKDSNISSIVKKEFRAIVINKSSIFLTPKE